MGENRVGTGQERRLGTDQSFGIMARPDWNPAPLRWFSENPEVVLRRLREGAIDALESADDQFTDLHVLYALKSGLLEEGAAAFPEPRLEPEIPFRLLFAAAVAGAFQGEY